MFHISLTTVLALKLLPQSTATKDEVMHSLLDEMVQQGITIFQNILEDKASG